MRHFQSSINLTSHGAQFKFCNVFIKTKFARLCFTRNGEGSSIKSDIAGTELPSTGSTRTERIDRAMRADARIVLIPHLIIQDNDRTTCDKRI